MAAVIHSSILEEVWDCGDAQCVLHGGLKVTVLEEKAVEVMGAHGVNGPALTPRGMFLKQKVGRVGKVGGNFTHLFICYDVLKLLDEEQMTVNDPLSGGDYMFKQRPLNSRRQKIN